MPQYSSALAAPIDPRPLRDYINEEARLFQIKRQLHNRDKEHKLCEKSQNFFAPQKVRPQVPHLETVRLPLRTNETPFYNNQCPIYSSKLSSRQQMYGSSGLLVGCQNGQQQCNTIEPNGPSLLSFVPCNEPMAFTQHHKSLRSIPLIQQMNYSNPFMCNSAPFRPLMTSIQYPNAFESKLRSKSYDRKYLNRQKQARSANDSDNVKKSSPITPLKTATKSIMKKRENLPENKEETLKEDESGGKTFCDKEVLCRILAPEDRKDVDTNSSMNEICKVKITDTTEVTVVGEEKNDELVQKDEKNETHDRSTYACF
ncbi:hypothetical protein ACOME3_006357 [Neoechinorhynchus agilis]